MSDEDNEDEGFLFPCFFPIFRRCFKDQDDRDEGTWMDELVLRMEPEREGYRNQGKRIEGGRRSNGMSNSNHDFG